MSGFFNLISIIAETREAEVFIFNINLFSTIAQKTSVDSVSLVTRREAVIKPLGVLTQESTCEQENPRIMPGSCQRPFVFLLIICSKKFYKVGIRFFCSNYESSYSSVNSYLNYFNSGSFSVWLSERNSSRSIDLHQVQVEKRHITCVFYFKGDAENSSAKLDSIKAKLSFEKVISELLITD